MPFMDFRRLARSIRVHYQQHPDELVLLIFINLWLLGGWIQSYFMDMAGEEAYYWMFSQNLDWGYLDHPPMVAWMTAIGYAIFPDNLGARLMMVVLNTATLFLVYKTLDRRNVWLFLACTVGLLAVHAGAFYVKTDVPLIFGEALFFFTYKRFLEKSRPWNIALLSFSIAFMFLSKYHGFLIVLFTVVANWKLVLRRDFWWVVAGVVVLMLPHTLWQYEHDWASIRFHLQERSDINYSFKNTINYVISQPIVLGPLVSLIMLPAAILYKTKNEFEKSLKFVLVGVLLFFFVNSFKVYIHKHWTSIAVLPMILLAYRYIFTRRKLRKAMIWVASFSFGVFVLFRIYLAYDFLPDSIDGEWENLHNWSTWAKEVDSLSGGREVVFLNDYDNASRFAYLTGRPVHVMSNYFFNGTHYDYWGGEERVQGKSVLLIDNKRHNEEFEVHETAVGVKVRHAVVNNYRSYSRVEVECLDLRDTYGPGQDIKVRVALTNPHDYPVSSRLNPTLAPDLHFYFLRGERSFSEGVAAEDVYLKPGGSQKVIVTIRTPEEEGRYQLRWGVAPGWIPASINSPRYTVDIR